MTKSNPVKILEKSMQHTMLVLWAVGWGQDPRGFFLGYQWVLSACNLMRSGNTRNLIKQIHYSISNFLSRKKQILIIGFVRIINFTKIELMRISVGKLIENPIFVCNFF